MFNDIELIPEKSYFVMSDNSVKTYYRTKINSDKLYISVFNRDIDSGEEILNLENVKAIFTLGTKQFDLAIYKLVTFISDDLTTKPELRKFFIEIWNEFSDKIFAMQFEDNSLPINFKNYLDDLETRYEDPFVVAYFKEKYYFQKFKYVPYSENWLKHHKETHNQEPTVL